jgi:hypothetical protein
MTETSPTPTPIDPHLGPTPRADTTLTAEQVAAAAGISTATLERLVRTGIVEPANEGGHDFTAATAVRLRRMLRLHHDLDVDLMSATIIVDLLERLDRLEQELLRWRTRSFDEPGA